MNKRKLLPTVIMLFAGGTVSISMVLMQYDLKTMLGVLLAVLLVFYIIGLLIKKMLDNFDEKNHKESDMESEGEVIEKENSSDGEEDQLELENDEA